MDGHPEGTDDGVVDDDASTADVAVDEIAALGLDWSTDQLLLSTPTSDAAAAVPEPIISRDVTGELGFGEPIDPFDPREVGWVVVVAANDPDREQLVAAIKPLAARRGGAGSWGPIELPPKVPPATAASDYIDVRDPVPKYVLLLGSPRCLSFDLQSFLGRYHAVGRLDFSTISDDGKEQQDIGALTAYVDKVIRLEEAEPRQTAMPVVLWAPSGGRTDPTFYSRRVMVEPLAGRLTDKRHVANELLVADRATKDELLKVVTERQPAILFTASHGRAVADADGGLPVQAKRNGSLVDQRLANFTVDDLPDEKNPFVEGGLIYSFACFGYGTPSSSGYAHWNERVGSYHASQEFVSALPKGYLSHPRGPIAFIGHADYALLHAFSDPNRPGKTTDVLSSQLAKYREALDNATHGNPYSWVLAPLAGRLAEAEGELVQTWDDAQKSKTSPNSAAGLMDKFLKRNDARASMLLGDPAAKPRLR